MDIEKNNEVFLKQGNVSGTWICSICEEEFHISPVGPMKPITAFEEHVREKHPELKITRPTYRLKNKVRN
jgi:hypothetical protein